jgi:hypothetical protein
MTVADVGAVVHLLPEWERKEPALLMRERREVDIARAAAC